MSIERTVYYIEGDGIGPEIWQASRPVIDAALRGTDAKIDWRPLLAGEKAVVETGSPLPVETLETLASAELAIKGPLGTPVGQGIRSLNVALRQGLDLYACIRPIEHIPGLPTPVKHPEKVKMIIFRENTEDVYAGLEYPADSKEAEQLRQYLQDALHSRAIAEGSAIGIKPMSEKASKRLIRRAIRHALDNNLPSVTLVHKGNIMKFTEGGFRKWGYELAEEEFSDLVSAEKVPGKLHLKDRIADAMFQEALLHPEEYSVLATPNLNGDYISDALAAQVGGLGLAPGVNMSDKMAFFEATHGTAPSIAGKDLANPGSLILCGALLLDHIGEKVAARKIRVALQEAIARGAAPADLMLSKGREVGCREFGDIVGSLVEELA